MVHSTTQWYLGLARAAGDGGQTARPRDRGFGCMQRRAYYEDVMEIRFAAKFFLILAGFRCNVFAGLFQGLK
jgi:hypothetical protein